jgi:acetylornithine deacetylase/succinyl-diaminopimelate desuccinylase-like protein
MTPFSSVRPVPDPHDRSAAAGDGDPLAPHAEAEVVDLCRGLVQIDTSNYGDGSGPGERDAAELVAALLDEVGISVQLFEPAPRRTSLITRIPGRDPSRPALVLHGHLDVVPAQAEDWQVPPFSGEVRDGVLWGRGAVDMKGMDAMILAVVRELARHGRQPARDVVLAFFADEEAGGRYGAQWLVQNHPELFAGATEAVSEVGGFSAQIAGHRTYLLQTAEKGLAWLRLLAHGTAGHGSVPNDDNAVTRVSSAIARIGAHRWPTELTPTGRDFLTGLSDLAGTPISADDTDTLTDLLGPLAASINATFRNTANPTGLDAGYKHNVVPGHASAVLDCRFLPGQQDVLLSTIRELAGPGITIETEEFLPALESPTRSRLTDAMAAALTAEDPEAATLPYCMTGGTDNKSLAGLGIAGYGFAPLRLPSDLDFMSLFHAVDERVPTDSLVFGVRVLRRFLDTC